MAVNFNDDVLAHDGVLQLVWTAQYLREASHCLERIRLPQSCFKGCRAFGLEM